MRRFRPLSTSGRSPLRVVRLPGELTGSGTTCPTPAPRAAICATPPCGRFTPEGWFPGSGVGGPAATTPDSARRPRGPGLVHLRTAPEPAHANRAAAGRQTLDQRVVACVPLPRARVARSHPPQASQLVPAVRRTRRPVRPPARPAAAAAPGRPAASTSSARRSSSSKVSSGGGPSSTVTTQSWQASPRTTQVSQSIARRHGPGTLASDHRQSRPVAAALRQCRAAALRPRAAAASGRRRPRSAPRRARRRGRPPGRSETTTSGRPGGSAATSSRITSSAITPDRAEQHPHPARGRRPPAGRRGGGVEDHGHLGAAARDQRGQPGEQPVALRLERRASGQAVLVTL